MVLLLGERSEPTNAAEMAGLLARAPARVVAWLPADDVLTDIANAVAFLASARAEWITGQVLSVNGGYSMAD